MAIFPVVQNPCPYKSRLSEVMEGDMCRMCKRQVIDLSAMTDAGRMAFMRGCAQEVCVSYRLPVRPAIAAAALAASLLALPAAASTGTPSEVPADSAAFDYSDMDIIVGGIRDVKTVAYVEVPEDAAIPELPVIVEKKGDPSR